MPFAMKSLILPFTLCLFLVGSTLWAQSGAAGRPYQRTRGMAPRAYDLPYLTVEAPKPQTASDLLTLTIYSPDSMEIGLHVREWMYHGKPNWEMAFRIGPGKQEVEVPLYALAEGDYTLRVYRRERVVAAKHFSVMR